MSDYIPDSDRSLFAIAEALERIADAQEALVEIARQPRPAPCPWPWPGPGSLPPSPAPSSPWYWPVTTGTGTPPPFPTTGSDGSHG